RSECWATAIATRRSPIVARRPEPARSRPGAALFVGRALEDLAQPDLVHRDRRLLQQSGDIGLLVGLRLRLAQGGDDRVPDLGERGGRFRLRIHEADDVPAIGGADRIADIAFAHAGDLIADFGDDLVFGRPAHLAAARRALLVLGALPRKSGEI